MVRKSGLPPIVYILIFLLLAGGYWIFKIITDKKDYKINIDGSTSMVRINENLKVGFQEKYKGSIVTTNARGSDKGIEYLQAGTVDIAAVSRPLSVQEITQNLVAVPIVTDQIAVAVAKENPFKGGLTSTQLAGIFQGKINKWSAVGGPETSIQIINRPYFSGTHQMFKEQVLGGRDFGPYVIAWPIDETTGVFRVLGNNGISYATYAQAGKQSTIRVVPINGIMPETATYPYKRTLFYVYKNPASPAVKAFTEYAISPEGQQVLAQEKKN